MRVDNTRRVSLPTGTNITLKCTEHSNTNISRYFWNSSGTFQTLSQSPTLRIRNASVTDSGYYYCYTINSFGDRNGSLSLNITIYGEFRLEFMLFYISYVIFLDLLRIINKTILYNIYNSLIIIIIIIFIIDLQTPRVQATKEGFISDNTDIHLSCYSLSTASSVVYQWFKWVDYFKWDLVGTTQTIRFPSFDKNDSGNYICLTKAGPLKKLSRDIKIVVACTFYLYRLSL